jgi:hypothetical protein
MSTAAGLDIQAAPSVLAWTLLISPSVRFGRSVAYDLWKKLS